MPDVAMAPKKWVFPHPNEGMHINTLPVLDGKSL